MFTVIGREHFAPDVHLYQVSDELVRRVGASVSADSVGGVDTLRGACGVTMGTEIMVMRGGDEWRSGVITDRHHSQFRACLDTRGTPFPAFETFYPATGEHEYMVDLDRGANPYFRVVYRILPPYTRVRASKSPTVLDAHRFRMMSAIISAWRNYPPTRREHRHGDVMLQELRDPRGVVYSPRLAHYLSQVRDLITLLPRCIPVTHDGQLLLSEHHASLLEDFWRDYDYDIT